MPEEVPLMDEEKTRLESSLRNLFDKNIKHTLGKEAILTNIELNKIGKNGKRHESEFFHATLTYKSDRKEGTLPLLLKKTEEIKHIEYERKLYNFYSSLPLDCLLKCYGQLHDSNTNEKTNYLALELFDNVKEFDNISLEERLVGFNKEIEEHRGNKEKINEIFSNRLNLLRKIINVVADFDYWGTKKLLVDASKDKEKNIYKLLDNENKEWFIKTYGEEYYKERFFNDMLGIYKHFSKHFNLTNRQIERYLRTIKKITTPPKDGKSIFKWAEFGPMQFLVHRDLHAGNILVSDDTIKLIDLKNVGVGSALIDLGFTQNPYYNPNDEERRHMLDTYLTQLKTLSDKDSSRIEIMSNLKEKFDFYEFDKQDRIRQIAWNMRIAKEICGYVDKFGRYQTDLKKHLKYTNSSLNRISSLDYIISEYSYLKRLQHFFEKTQVSKTYNHPNI